MKTLRKRYYMALFLIRQISHSAAKFIIWCIHKLIDCVCNQIRNMDVLLVSQQRNHSHSSILINDVQKLGFSYNRANNIWKPLSPVCIRKSVILPSDCYCLWHKQAQYAHYKMGLSPVYYRQMCCKTFRAFLP